jgi:hypothetical protein
MYALGVAVDEGEAAVGLISLSPAEVAICAVLEGAALVDFGLGVGGNGLLVGVGLGGIPHALSNAAPIVPPARTASMRRKEAREMDGMASSFREEQGEL